jgi:exopolyphosphatase/guanosine-5'-triphosphate,3'-diphosphate pyrophosphatase
MSQPSAVVDLGTNTARLLIGTAGPGLSIQQHLLKRYITRLGGGFTKEAGISAEAEERSLAALMDFAAEIQRAGVARVRAVATSAVRDAANGQAFCARVLARTGLRLEVIDGEEEGLCTLRGVLAGLDERSGEFLVFDIGGGSTEYTVARGTVPLFTRSLPLGVVRLTEGKVDCDAMAEKIDRELGELLCQLETAGLLKSVADATLIGTAGTATTLAAIHLKMADYDYRLVNNHTLTRQDVEDILALLLPLTPTERLKIQGLEPGREDLIIAGTLITLSTMKLLGFNKIKISDYGLLEGLLLVLAEAENHSLATTI